MKISGILLICLGLQGISFAQKYPYKEYTVYDGLSQMQTTCLYQDSRGYLWIGTKDGLSKSNGEAFESYRSSGTLPGTYVTDIKEDREGNMWLGFRQDGVARFDGKFFESYSLGQGVEGSKIEIDENNRIMVFNYLGGVKCFNGDGFTDIEKVIPVLQSVGAIQFGVFDEDAQRTLFYSDSTGLWALKDDKIQPIKDVEGRFKNFLRKSGPHSPLLIKSVLKNGNLAISRLFDHHCEKIFESSYLRSSDDIYAFNEEELLYHDNKKVFRVDIKTGSRKPLNDWPVSWFRAILSDREGNLWLATENGLFQHYGEVFVDLTDSLPPFVWSIVEDNDKNIWFASYGFGLNKYDGYTFKEVNSYKTLFPRAEFYTGALLNKQGNLIFPVTSGLLQFDGKHFSWLDHKAAGNSPQFVYEDSEKDLLLTAVRYGFRIIDKTGNVQQFGLEDGIHPNDFIVCIGKGKEGRYWLGSDYGLSRFNPQDKTFENFTHTNGKLPSSGILAIHRDFKENMWFGGRDGLLTFDYETGQISKIAGSEINSRVSFILSLKETYLLIGTLEGLFLFNLEKFYAKNTIELKLYSESNGFTGIQPIQNGAFRDSDGLVWIPSRNGVIRLNPEKLNFQVSPLQTYFTEINGEKIGFYKEAVKLKRPYESNEFKIHYEAVGFSRPLKTQYSYRIIEGSDEWSDWQEENFVLLTNLSSGDYQLEVKSKAIGTLPEKAVAASLFFTVDLNFWEEPYFYQVALLIMLGLTGLLCINYFRQSALRRRASANERENRYLKIQTLQAQMSPHFIFNVLGTLQNQILKSNTDEANRHLVNLSKLIRNFLNASVKSEIPKGISLDNEIALEKEVELIQMYIDFERLQYGEVFDYEIIIDDALKAANYSVPPMIIQPYVENAIKHGLLPKKEKGRLIIRLSGNNDNFLGVIEDDGIGRENAKALQESSLARRQSLGLATNLVSKRIAILNEMGYNIKIETTNRTGGGTIVTIKIKS